MRKVTREQSKEHNNHLILKVIYDSDQISRADVARVTKLTRTTVSSAVDELAAQGILVEVGRGQSLGGKPPTLMRVNKDSRHVIGLDLGNEEMRGSIVNLRGEIIQSEILPAEGVQGKEYVQLVFTLINRLITKVKQPLLGIGIGTPGLVESKGGLIRRAVNRNWTDLPLRQLVEDRFQMPVLVANDCHAAALAQFTFGSIKKVPSLVVLKIGEGIGAGLILDNKLFFGDNSAAGEIGHLVVVDKGDLCSCGHFGCLETVASSRAIINEGRKLFYSSSPENKLKNLVDNPEKINLETLEKAIQAGDAGVRSLIQSVGYYLGIAAASIVSLINVNQVVIAGEVACFGPVLTEVIQKTMEERSVDVISHVSNVSFSNLGENIVTLGAATLLIRNKLEIV